MDCKFTKDELIAFSVAIKIAANSNIGMFIDTYNSLILSKYPEEQAKHMFIKDEQSMLNYLIELRGNVKSLIRNSND